VPEPLIEVTVDQPRLHVGSPVRALMRWQADRDPEAVRLELRWVTEGRGDTDSAVVTSHRHGPELGPVPPVVEAVLAVPPSGPVTYDGHMIRVRWEVRGVLELRWAVDPTAACPILVLPLPLPATS
jgi:hypothetical protein